MPISPKIKKLFEQIALRQKRKAQERRAAKGARAQDLQASRESDNQSAAVLHRARGRSHYSHSFQNEQGKRLPACAIDGFVLPPRILSLDIETARTRFRKVEESTIAVVGLVPYALCRDGHYERGVYQYFLRDELPALHQLLAVFDGLILGQNVFDFDYRVLRPHIPFAGIVEKTFDLLFFLSEIDVTRGARLSLEVLAKRNLKQRKLASNRDIPSLWRSGDVKTVLKRNERDCDLVVHLWLKLVNERRLTTKHRHSDAPNPVIEVKEQHLPILLGHEPFMEYQEWMRRLAKWGNARRDPATGGKTIVRETVAPADILVFHRMWCPDCQRTFILRAGRTRIYKPCAAKACPFCKHRLALADGATLTTSGAGSHFHFLSLRNAFWVNPEHFPAEDAAMEFIRRMRYGRY